MSGSSGAGRFLSLRAGAGIRPGLRRIEAGLWLAGCDGAL